MPPYTKRYTIRDIAKEVGVSTTTVSRYLAGYYHYMSKETKERIRLAIIKYNYRPNQLARGLQSNKSGLIGVVIHQMQRPLLSYSLQGVCVACDEIGYSPIFVSTEEDPVREKEKVQSLIDHRVEGILCFTGTNEVFYDEISRGGTPVIFVDRHNPESSLDGVFINHYSIVQEALLSLYVSGCKEIALFRSNKHGGFPPNSTIPIRENAYHDFMAQYKLDTTQLIYSFDETDMSSIESALRSFVKNITAEKKAIFVSSMSALPAVDKICQLTGIRYPEDSALVGYAMKGDVNLISSEITTITQPVGKMTQVAVNLLNKRINESGQHDFIPQKIEVEAELEIRKSTLFA